MTAVLQPGVHDTLFGLIRIAGLCAALPVAAIREVVPCPSRLEPFPASRPDIAGALELRGEVIPVIDLAQALNPSVDGGGQQFDERSIVVILRQEQHIFAVLADGIIGVMPLTTREISPLSQAATDEGVRLFFSTFRVAAHNGVVLDPAAIIGLPGMVTATDRAASKDDSRQIDEPILVFTVAGLRLALPASCVDASLPSADLLPTPKETELWIAQREYKGAEIPVVDTLHLLGHGSLPKGRRSGAGIVVRTQLPNPVPPGWTEPFGLVALLIDTVDDIGRFAARCFSPLLQDAVAGAVLSLGILETADGSALLINAQKLAAHEGLRNLGVIRNVQETATTAVRIGQADELTTRPTEKPFLVFSVGDQRFSTPLGSVEEILLAQAATLPMPSGDCGMLGLFASRGHCVPLLDLSYVLGEAATRDGRYIIVTRTDHPDGLRRAGFRVDELHSVDRKALQEVGAKDRTAHLPGLPGPTIRLSDGHACTVLDLAGAAERLLNVQQEAARN
ncbi:MULTISPECIES: chemotaxis protein CheW [unclassified Novosphingobium]|uniref:chemotaxis protein CheW n=1 Tax=unclassified Novosphingobium TaxID=2644732 RepID=UPI000783C5E8|nr:MULTISPECIES: chemotaxis protein CheW [unclassified Novosphingobium]QOV95740.1 chemotaxis protein CheW [Novosphingobium sp. ES2-1]